MPLKKQIIWKKSKIYGLIKNNLKYYDKIKFVEFYFESADNTFKLLKWTAFNEDNEEILVPCDLDSSTIEKFLDDTVHQYALADKKLNNCVDNIYATYKESFNKEY